VSKPALEPKPLSKPKPELRPMKIEPKPKPLKKELEPKPMTNKTKKSVEEYRKKIVDLRMSEYNSS
jgi:hypothetical protein